MIAVIGDEDFVVAIDRQVSRRLELSVAAAAPAEPSLQPQVGVEHENTVVGGVRHDHVTAVGGRDAVRPRRKFAVAVPGRCRRFDVTSSDQPAHHRLDHGHAPPPRRRTLAATTSGCDVIVQRYRDVAFRRDGYAAQSASYSALDTVSMTTRHQWDSHGSARDADYEMAMIVVDVNSYRNFSIA